MKKSTIFGALICALVLVGIVILNPAPSDEEVLVTVTEEEVNSITFAIPKTVIDGRDQQPTDQPVGKVKFQGRIF